MLPVMKTPMQIIDALGVEQVAAQIGVDRRRVLRARYDDQMPALWYAGICEMTGEALPYELFTFKRADRGAA